MAMVGFIDVWGGDGQCRNDFELKSRESPAFPCSYILVEEKISTISHILTIIDVVPSSINAALVAILAPFIYPISTITTTDRADVFAKLFCNTAVLNLSSW